MNAPLDETTLTKVHAIAVGMFYGNQPESRCRYVSILGKGNTTSTTTYALRVASGFCPKLPHVCRTTARLADVAGLINSQIERVLTGKTNLKTPMLFTELPREVIEEVLVRCDPIDVAQVAQACSELFFIIYRSEDQRLWRELYLSQSLDDPRGTVSHLGVERPGPIDWKTDLQRVIRAGIVVSSHNSLILLRPGELHTILDTLLQTVCYTNPRRSQEPFGEVSSNLLWVAAMFRGGFLDNAKEVCGSSVSLEDRMRLARLHTYYGVTHGDALTKNLVQSRAFVYLMRNYRPETGYGPFLENGEVNWVHMQAIHHVVSMHLVSLKEDEDFDFVIYPMCLPYTQTAIPNEQQPENDWAGVTGTWTVSFCFCDHRDLMAFNHASAKALDTSLFEDPDFREVFRSLEAKVNIVRTEHDPANPSHPIIHFYGEMQDPSTSMMTGHVKLTSDNQIQWHFVSGEAGSAIWSSAGVQVGGLRSSFGVLGSWTTVFHEDDDPVGPFWLCKRTITNANGQQGA